MTNQDYIDFMNIEKTEKQEQIATKQQTITTLEQAIDQSNVNITYYTEQKTNEEEAIGILNAGITTIDEIIAILEAQPSLK